MTTQKRQDRIRTERRNTIRKKQVAKRRMFLLLSAVFIVTIGSIIYGSIFSSAKDESTDAHLYKYFKSIEKQNKDRNLQYSMDRLFRNELLNTLEQVFINDFGGEKE